MTYSKNKLKKISRYLKTGSTSIRNMKNKAPNQFELSIYEILEKEHIEYEREYQIPGTSKFYDLYLPKYNTLIELDGDFWHPIDILEAKTAIQKRNFRNDIFKNKLAFKYGFRLIRIRQSENIISVEQLLK